jgi:copper chaperone CopZ
MNPKKILLSVVFVFILITTITAQVNKVVIQASGLTCSMCSNAINKSLKTVSFIKDIQPNLKESTFDITIKPGADVDFNLLKKKVEDAGFFVAKMDAYLLMNQVSVQSDAHVVYQNMILHFLNVPNKQLDGLTRLQIMNKGFVDAKTYKKNAKLSTLECYKTGKLSDCCKPYTTGQTLSLYHVTF